jgi:hypothetical protein
MAITYFGNVDSSGNPLYSSTTNTGGVVTGWNYGTETEFTCPGSGSQLVKYLQVMCNSSLGAAHSRLAIYSSDGATLIAQGSAEFSITGGSDAWQGHTWTTGFPVLTGGTKYRIAVCADGDVQTTHARDSYPSNCGYYDTVDRTGGFSEPLPAGSQGNVLWPMRCGVEPVPVRLKASSYIDSGGAQATTYQLTAPAGKVTSDFEAGCITDDTNPLRITSVFADNFNRADGVLGSNWTTEVGTPRIASYTITGNSNCGAHYNGSVSTADCMVKMKVDNLSSGGEVDLAMRSTSNSNLYNCYMMSVTASNWGFYRNVSDTPTLIGALQTRTFVDGSVVAFRIIGSTLQASFDGGATWQAYTQTDTTYPSGGYAGFFVSNGTVVLDDFELYNLYVFNPSSEKYSEWEVCVEAVSGVVATGDEIEFRMTNNGVALDSYSYTPKWTIGTSGSRRTTFAMPMFFRA